MDTRKRVAIHARVSTDRQTTNQQLSELRAAAERHGWLVAEKFIEQGISGAKGGAGIAGRDLRQ